MMYALVGLDGTAGEEALLDERVCECCRTAAAKTPDGLAAVYRDRSEKEVRDISIVRLKHGGWSQPQPLSQDGWEINGCPINGPAISSAGENLAAVWFTAARGEARVFAALSNDGGATFGPQIRVDGGSPTGRVDVAALPLGNAFVSWVERTGSTAEVRVLLVNSDQSTSEPIIVGAAVSGIPRLAVSGDEVVVAWTNSEDNKVRTSTLRIAQGQEGLRR